MAMRFAADMVSQLISDWPSIPRAPRPMEDPEFPFRLGKKWRYTTITGWEVQTVSGPLECYKHYNLERGEYDYPEFNWKQKAFWNAVSILFLPVRLYQISMRFLDLPAWGLYLIVTQCVVLPWYKDCIAKWRAQSLKVSKYQKDLDGKSTICFSAWDGDYVFDDYNSYFGNKKDDSEAEEGSEIAPFWINKRLVVADANDPTDTDTTATPKAPAMLYVVSPRRWERMEQATRFCPTKVLLGVMLCYATVVSSNVLFLLAAAIKLVFIEAQKKPLYLIRLYVADGWFRNLYKIQKANFGVILMTLVYVLPRYVQQNEFWYVDYEAKLRDGGRAENGRQEAEELEDDNESIFVKIVLGLGSGIWWISDRLDRILDRILR